MTIEDGSTLNISNTKQTIPFGKKLASSEAFSILFQDGMSLVEETAAYLDGPGRECAKNLPKTIALTYATESMRLTTRLMQLASWLLLQRAVNDGEMSQEQAQQEKNKVKLSVLAKANRVSGWKDLPEDFCNLVIRSVRLQERVIHLDKAIHNGALEKEIAVEDIMNPVAEQINILQKAFNTTP